MNVFSFLVIVLSLAQGPTARADEDPGPVKGPFPTSVAVDETPAPPPDLVARAGERTISRRSLDVNVAAAARSQAMFHQVSGARMAVLAREELQKLIRRELDILEGLDRGIPLPIEEAEKERAEVEKSLGKEAYSSSMKALGWDARRHTLALAESKVATRTYVRFVKDAAAASPGEVRAEWEANPKKFAVQEMVHVFHILLRVASTATPDEWKKREETATALLERLKGGEPFGDVAAANSDDMYRIKGGDLGWVHKGRLLPPLEEALWNAKDGDLVGPLRSEEGLHIARVGERKPGRVMPFEEAAPIVKRELEEKKLKRAEQKWYSDLRAKYPVIILDAALREDAVPK